MLKKISSEKAAVGKRGKHPLNNSRKASFWARSTKILFISYFKIVELLDQMFQITTYYQLDVYSSSPSGSDKGRVRRKCTVRSQGSSVLAVYWCGVVGGM